MFVASSYFGALPTEENAAFKEKYYRVPQPEWQSFALKASSSCLKDQPVLNALGQSTYEGVHFLAGLMQGHAKVWRDHSVSDAPPP